MGVKYSCFIPLTNYFWLIYTHRMNMLRRFTGSVNLFFLSFFIARPVVAQAPDPAQVQVNAVALNFQIPTFADILTFLIRFFFVIAGIAALVMLLWGALSWVTSGGEKEGVQKARDKIVNAIVGIILVVVALSIIWSMENIVFQKKICFGLSCPVTLPNLLKAPGAP